MNEAAITLDGWYALHDFRSMDWASWKLVSAEERQAAIEEFIAYLENLKQADTKTGTCILLSYRSKSRFHDYDFT